MRDRSFLKCSAGWTVASLPGSAGREHLGVGKGTSFSLWLCRVSSGTQIVPQSFGAGAQKAEAGRSRLSFTLTGAGDHWADRKGERRGLGRGVGTRTSVWGRGPAERQPAREKREQSAGQVALLNAIYMSSGHCAGQLEVLGTLARAVWEQKIDFHRLRSDQNEGNQWARWFFAVINTDSMGGWIMASQRRPCPHLQSLCVCYFIWQRRPCRCDLVKDLELGTLYWIIPGNPV